MQCSGRPGIAIFLSRRAEATVRAMGSDRFRAMRRCTFGAKIFIEAAAKQRLAVVRIWRPFPLTRRAMQLCDKKRQMQNFKIVDDPAHLIAAQTIG